MTFSQRARKTAIRSSSNRYLSRDKFDKQIATLWAIRWGYNGDVDAGWLLLSRGGCDRLPLNLPLVASFHCFSWKWSRGRADGQTGGSWSLDVIRDDVAPMCWRHLLLAGGICYYHYYKDVLLCEEEESSAAAASRTPLPGHCLDSIWGWAIN